MIEYTKLLIDFGLVVLVWVVQLAIYPSFNFFEIENLKKWHPRYSRGITWIVGPLMIAQLGISIYLLTLIQSWFIIANFILVTSTWVITFFWAIPIHQRIDKEEIVLEETFDKLLEVNRFRAWMWTIICVWTLGVMTL